MQRFLVGAMFAVAGGGLDAVFQGGGGEGPDGVDFFRAGGGAAGGGVEGGGGGGGGGEGEGGGGRGVGGAFVFEGLGALLGFILGLKGGGGWGGGLPGSWTNYGECCFASHSLRLSRGP